MKNRRANRQFDDLPMPEEHEQEVQRTAQVEKERLRKEVDEIDSEETDMSPEERVAQFLEEHHGISQRTVQNWKDQYGQIYMLPFDDDDIYIYRAIRSIEFNNLMMRMQNLQNATDNTVDVEMVKLCLIYPRIDPVEFNSQPAGWLSTMRVAIQKVSRFLSEDEIAAMTIRL